MRVTPGMLKDNFLYNLHRTLADMEKSQQMLSNGKALTKPSDDPVKLLRAMKYRSDITQGEQYQRNIEDGLNWLNTTDAALNELTNLLQRVKELTVYGANGALPQESLNSIAEEIKQIKEQVGVIANTQFAGKYIFGGTEVEKQPWDGSNWQGNSSGIYFEIGSNIKVQVNTVGLPLFTNVMQTLDQIINHLTAGDVAAVSSDLGSLDNNLNTVLAVRADVGARTNRLELMQNRLLAQLETEKELLSKTEDADIAATIIDLKNQENVYRSALAVGARILPPTLVDFLR
ncbi:flagellar hook-associated protein FlgL [Carboxydothermus hydrogenoformans]|uniref:Flagellar hook-associated protein 3 n=1 Tax=Carboxydothermus hydrogenoformans (strain ATCC BAA-161 / DSM 6008 / Z-2901) TaxID=246194 RepID=Q3ADG5_CARHZ|nr:flagellar hook-associated protein FlgL [Carboxydothermus hydrogenoformans]ABB16223.1 flagellar hook-associated protein 3 [Carboxydothermus hydrogenoformans Z-2901]